MLITDAKFLEGQLCAWHRLWVEDCEMFRGEGGQLQPQWCVKDLCHHLLVVNTLAAGQKKINSSTNWLFFFPQNLILYFDIVHFKSNILVWNGSNAMGILWALWILMTWSFSTRASVATVNTHASSTPYGSKYISNGLPWMTKLVFQQQFHWVFFISIYKRRTDSIVLKET